MRLAEANFNLRKFDTNSPELRQRIEQNEQQLSQEDNQECAQTRPSNLSVNEQEQQVFGVRWDVANDVLIFDLSGIAEVMKETRPTKRNAVSLATRFFDPLGMISPSQYVLSYCFSNYVKLRWAGTSCLKEGYSLSGKHLHLTSSNLNLFQSRDAAPEEKT